MSGKQFIRFVSVVVLGLAAASCSSSDDSSSATTAAKSAETSAAAETTAAAESTTTEAPATTEAATTTTEAATTTTEAPEVLRILVTDDDGYGAAGIDALVVALQTLDNVEITVIAPLDDKSGTGYTQTDGPLTVTDVTMPSGYPAKAVAGFPADTIIYAFDQGGLATKPHLVVSGINIGQNVSVAVPLSGTIGGAKAAALHGIPAVAASQQVVKDVAGADLPFSATSDPVLRWIEENRANLLDGTMPVEIYNFNGPSCTAGGEVRGVATVPLNPTGERYGDPADCVTADVAAPVDDIDALVKGYVSYTELDPTTLTPVP